MYKVPIICISFVKFVTYFLLQKHWFPSFSFYNLKQLANANRFNLRVFLSADNTF